MKQEHEPADLAVGRVERAWASAVLPSFAGGASEVFSAPAEDVDYVAAYARFVGSAAPKARLGVRVALLLVMTSPLWLAGRLRSFAALELEERSALLERLSSHRLFFVRELCLLVKLVACMAIFRSPALRARSGYDGAKAGRASSSARRALPVLAAASAAPERVEGASHAMVGGAA